ncbi:MAG: ATP-binding cassette domain-containing protein [Desulfomonile sp.]|jgi:ABC-2 type transport system ATP-binding protein|nr:ATP-binding cassette domain-containing protein [Deltaproteobacteria bacterium]
MLIRRRAGIASEIIVVKGLGKNFGSLTALHDLDLAIKEGELFGLLGPNGAGKTTLISILATILPPTRGSATICGHDIRHNQHEVRRSIGIVFQDPSLDDELTGAENLDFHARLYGLDTRARLSRMEEVLALVDLEDRRNDLVKTYSGGMRRRLEMARGLMHHPHVLFLDEPTLGLDPQTRRKIWNHILTLKDTFGMTVILTTHYMDEADHLCSAIAIMDHGQIVALDTPDALKSQLGGDVVYLETSPLDKEFVKDLRDAQEVTNVSIHDNILALTVAKGESFIPIAFDAAARFGVTISGVSMRKPNLEDVFIKITGREIRDEAVSTPKERIRVYSWGKRR